MKMNLIAVLLLLSLATLAGQDAAPASIVGTVFREGGNQPSAGVRVTTPAVRSTAPRRALQTSLN
jgi:hypothetical protein